MKVQEINTPKGLRYILLDDDYRPVDEVNRYLKFLDNSGKSPNTLKNYAFHLKTYYQYMQKQNIGVKDIGKDPNRGPIDILSGFMMYLQYPDAARNVLHLAGETAARGNNTVNTIMNTVLGFYQFLAGNNEIEELEVYRRQRTNEKFKSFLYEMTKKKTAVHSSIFKMKVPQKNLEYVTRAQFTEIFHCCTNTRDKLLVALLYEGGLRISEALGLHLEDVAGIEDGIIKIVARENNENGARVKNYAEGIIKVPDYVIDLLLEYLTNDIVEYDSDFLFLNLHGPTKGEPLKVATVEQLFVRLSSKVGYHVHPHMLRHGFATEKREFGWELDDISVYLRHKSISTTEIYVTYSDELKKEKMRSFLDAKQLEYGGVSFEKSNN